jgi:hypothetical protein
MGEGGVWLDGSTAVVIIIDGMEATIANIGDSAAAALQVPRGLVSMQQTELKRQLLEAYEATIANVGDPAAAALLVLIQDVSFLRLYSGSIQALFRLY